MTFNFNIRFGWLPTNSLTQDDLKALEERIVSVLSDKIAEAKAAVLAAVTRVETAVANGTATPEDLSGLDAITSGANSILPAPPAPEPTPTPAPENPPA